MTSSFTLGIYYMLKITFSLSGWCSWGSHSQLPAGEVPRGPPEPRRKKLPYILPAGGRRRRRSAPLAWSREKLQALPLLGAGQGKKCTTFMLLIKAPKPDFFTELFNWFFQGNCAKVSSINDKSDWKTVRKALSVIDLSESDIEVRMHIKSLYSLCVGD